MTSKIEWTDETWNPVTGCTKVSQGCKHCYAERMATRLAGRAGYPAAPHQFDVTLHPERLDDPLRWKKPRRIFVNSMSDLFHKDVPDEFIADVFWTMLQADWHTYQILTKRPERMYSWYQKNLSDDGEAIIFDLSNGERYGSRIDKLNFIWLGVSVEDDKNLWRIDWLLKTPTTVRFVSYEPALGPVDFTNFLPPRSGLPLPRFEDKQGNLIVSDLDWIIAGGETGPGARPAHPDWFRSVRDQCQAAGVPFFFKQVGGYPKNRLLDGREWNEYPEAKA